MKKCKTCKFYDVTKFTFNDCGKQVQINKRMGVCRISAPAIGKIPWPNVSENDSCGSHEEKKD